MQDQINAVAGQALTAASGGVPVGAIYWNTTSNQAKKRAA